MVFEKNGARHLDLRQCDQKPNENGCAALQNPGNGQERDSCSPSGLQHDSGIDGASGLADHKSASRDQFQSRSGNAAGVPCTSTTGRGGSVIQGDGVHDIDCRGTCRG